MTTTKEWPSQLLLIIVADTRKRVGPALIVPLPSRSNSQPIDLFSLIVAVTFVLVIFTVTSFFGRREDPRNREM